jgi:hypothetical protein
MLSLVMFLNGRAISPSPAVMCLKSIRDARQLLAKLNNNDDKAPLAPADSTLAKAPTN